MHDSIRGEALVVSRCCVAEAGLIRELSHQGSTCLSEFPACRREGRV